MSTRGREKEEESDEPLGSTCAGDDAEVDFGLAKLNGEVKKGTKSIVSKGTGEPGTGPRC